MGCIMHVRTERNNNDDPVESWEESEVSCWGPKRFVSIPKSTKSTNHLWPQGRRFFESFLNFKGVPKTSYMGKNVFDGGSSMSWATSRSDSSSLIPVPLTAITPQLCLGSFEDARNEIDLRERNITHIISLIGPSYLIEGISHEHSPMNDYGRSDLKRVFEKLWPFIEESQKPQNVLFVHCMSGQNRSATLVIAILMKIQRKTLRDAFQMVKKRRPMVQINSLYAKQLTKMELELFGQNTMPKNWMIITSVNIQSGSVIFMGDDLEAICATNNNIRSDSDKMNIIHENAIKSRPNSVWI